MVSFEVSFGNGAFRLRRLAQSSVCDDSTGGRGIFGRFAGRPCSEAKRGFT